VVEDKLYGSIDAARTIREGLLRTRGNFRYGCALSGSGRVVTSVVGEGVAFPVVRCYNRHHSIPLTEGWVKAGDGFFQETSPAFVMPVIAQDGVPEVRKISYTFSRVVETLPAILYSVARR
jgi:hypothetical protein